MSGGSSTSGSHLRLFHSRSSGGSTTFEAPSSGECLKEGTLTKDPTNGKVGASHERDFRLFHDRLEYYVCGEEAMKGNIPITSETAVELSGASLVISNGNKKLTLRGEKHREWLPEIEAAIEHAREIEGLPPTPKASRHTHVITKGKLFFSYRVKTDVDLVGSFYDKCTAAGMDIWWDKKCLKPGQTWEEGFVDGLFGSDVFVPFISKQALAPLAKLNAKSEADNMLLEFRLALELKAQGKLRAIFPVFVGETEKMGSLGVGFGQFARAKPVPNEVVVQVEAKAKSHLSRKGFEAQIEGTAVASVLQGILNHQGTFLRGVKEDAMENVVAALAKLMEKETLREEKEALEGKMEELRKREVRRQGGPQSLIQP